MAGLAPSPPSKDMAALNVTSGHLARLRAAHSASSAGAARAKDGGHGDFTAHKKDGVTPPPKQHGGLHINTRDHSPSLIINLLHRSRRKPCPLLTWQPA